MLELHGSAISNYYNKVKLALLEKQVPFAEVSASPFSADEEMRQASPLGKIPFLRTEQGTVCESQVLLEYIEARWPQPALLPPDPFAAAKVRELATYIDWHLEIVARPLYGAAFFGQAPLSEGNLARIRQQLISNIVAFKRLAKFAPFVAGDSFSQADCSAFNNLPMVGMASKAVLGEDLLLAGGIDYKPYIKRIAERPSAQQVVADRKAVQTKF